MACLLRRIPTLNPNLFLRVPAFTAFPTRDYSLKIRKPKKIAPISKKFEVNENALKMKGFLRPIKPYEPPSDIRVKLSDIFTRAGIDQSARTKITDAGQRFSLLKECFDTFSHGVPNSLLHTMDTVGNIVDYYLTPVDVTTPLDAMKKMDLPENLHVQYEYHRFHPDTDTMFRGISAFPKSSTLVTGLKARKKYPGYDAKRSWP